MTISFKSKDKIKTTLDAENLKELIPSRPVLKERSKLVSGRRKMPPDGNLGMNKGMENIGIINKIGIYISHSFQLS